jgi:ferredoxin
VRARARGQQGQQSAYINPDECIDCGACEPVCPVEAILPEDALDAEDAVFLEDNARFFKEVREAIPHRVNPAVPSLDSMADTGRCEPAVSGGGVSGYRAQRVPVPAAPPWRSSGTGTDPRREATHGMMSEQEAEFRAAATRLTQAMRHYPPSADADTDLEPLNEAVGHLATLLAEDAEVDHVENAALAVIDVYDRSGLEIADAAVIAAMERLREAATELDESDL